MRVLKGNLEFKCRRCGAKFTEASMDVPSGLASDSLKIHECDGEYAFGLADIIGGDIDVDPRREPRSTEFSEALKEFWEDGQD